MTSSTQAEPWLARVRNSGRWLVLDESLAWHPVEGRGGLEVVIDRLQPGERVLVAVGREEAEVAADDQGQARWWEPEALRAVAGDLLVSVTRAGQAPRSLGLQVQPTKLTQAQLVALIADLEACIAGLSGSLSGRGVAELTQTSPAEAAFSILERAMGTLQEAIPWVQSSPLHRIRERVSARPAQHAPQRVGDVRWLETHPAAVERVVGRGQQVAVFRERQEDMDVPENRGVLTLLQHLAKVQRTLTSLLEAEQSQLEGARDAHRAMGLPAPEDSLGRAAIHHRQAALQRIEEDLRRSRRRLRLPAMLRRGPFLRTARVETHPGYWSLYRAWEETRSLLPLSSSTAQVPLRSTDELYEVWCALQVLAALRRWAGPLEQVTLPPPAWFSRLPRGVLARTPTSDREVVLSYEPRYCFEGDDPIAKLHRGRPWRPDLVLEIRRAGRLPQLHIFDAKYRLEDGGPPHRALHEVWLKYPESIGDRRSRLPVVASTWVLYPGDTPRCVLLGPAMLSEAWPTDRVRGGMIAMSPGVGSAQLDQVLEVLLR